MIQVRQAIVQTLSLRHAPDRLGVVGAVPLAWAFVWPLVGMGITPSAAWVFQQMGLGAAWRDMLTYGLNFGVPLAIWLFLARQQPDFSLRLGLRARLGPLARRVALWGVPFGLILVQAANTVGLGLWEWMGKAPPEAGHGVFMQMKHEHGLDIALRALTAVVLAPLCEEALFRGLIQTGVQSLLAGQRPATAKWRWACVCGVGLVFGLVHAGAVPAPMLPSLVLLGVFLGWSYERTGCFWVPVLIHAGFNAISFAVGWQQMHSN